MHIGTQRFEVKPEHITLLRNANVDWDGGEFGAPAIDCKRPYGNSDVYGDIAELLGITVNEEDDERANQQHYAMRQIHEQTKTALQIFLATGEMKPGIYEAEKYHRNWRLVSAT